MQSLFKRRTKNQGRPMLEQADKDFKSASYSQFCAERCKSNIPIISEKKKNHNQEIETIKNVKNLDQKIILSDFKKHTNHH